MHRIGTLPLTLALTGQLAAWPLLPLVVCAAVLGLGSVWPALGFWIGATGFLLRVAPRWSSWPRRRAFATSLLGAALQLAALAYVLSRYAQPDAGGAGLFAAIAIAWVALAWFTGERLVVASSVFAALATILVLAGLAAATAAFAGGVGGLRAGLASWDQGLLRVLPQTFAGLLLSAAGLLAAGLAACSLSGTAPLLARAHSVVRARVAVSIALLLLLLLSLAAIVIGCAARGLWAAENAAQWPVLLAAQRMFSGPIVQVLQFVLLAAPLAGVLACAAAARAALNRS